MPSTLAKLNSNVARSLSAVSLHKVVQVAGLAATVALLPRLFGPEDYGRFAFVLSLSYLGQILGDFGTLDVLGRFVPGLSAAEAGQLYTRHLAFKLLVGAACSVISMIAGMLLAEWLRLEWAALLGMGVFLHILGWVPYQFALGLNRIGLWMSEQAWRQWALLLLLLALLPPLRLTGALLALLAMEIIFLGLGLWGVRAYWQPAQFRFDWPFLRPYINFGAGFFLANLTAVALYRSGPLLIESLTGDSVQTGYFNLALGLFMLAYVTIGQFAQSLIPGLSELRQSGQSGAARRWLANFVKVGWGLGVVGLALVWLAADWATPLVFGPKFTGAAAAFKWISLGFPLAVLLWAAGVAATVLGRGRLKFTASLAGLAVFVGLLAALADFGAMGAAIALVAALAVNTLALAWGLWRRADG